MMNYWQSATKRIRSWPSPVHWIRRLRPTRPTVKCRRAPRFDWLPATLKERNSIWLWSASNDRSSGETESSSPSVCPVSMSTLVSRQTKQVKDNKHFSPHANQRDWNPFDLVDEREDRAAMDQLGTVAGWGWNDEEGVNMSSKLHRVQVPLMSRAECEKRFLTAGYAIPIDKTKICAGWPQGGQDACQVKNSFRNLRS